MSAVTHEWVISHTDESCHIWMSHVTEMNDPCHTWKGAITHEWVVSHMNGCPMHKWVMSREWMSHVTSIKLSLSVMIIWWQIGIIWLKGCFDSILGAYEVTYMSLLMMYMPYLMDSRALLIWGLCLPYSTPHCNTLQHTATHCNTLQHTATHCNTLQHTATHSLGIKVPYRSLSTRCLPYLH